VAIDITAVRAEFPSLQAGSAHFDGPGGTQTPRAVIDAIAGALGAPLSNRGRATIGERNADDIVLGARQAIGDLVGVDPAGVVFGRSATQLAYDFSRTLSCTWSNDDEVVVTRLDHDSNVRPWVQAAERVGATVRWAQFDPASGELTPDDVAAVLSDRTRVVAVTAASNLIGTRPDVAAIAQLAHDVGALVFVDGVHAAAHNFIDVAALGADLFTCSPYKFLGPHLGTLAARPELLETLHPDKLLPATDVVPERFEFGTLPYEMLAGVRAAVDFLAGLDPGCGETRRTRLESSFESLEDHEDALRVEIENGLRSLPGVVVHSRARRRTPTLLVTFEQHSTADAARLLAARGVDAPSGSFYALEASRHLGLGDTGGLRIGLAPYSDQRDVERLLVGLAEFLDSPGRD
jgi:cysteine desulfurase family protein (TIGR01976 family)